MRSKFDEQLALLNRDLTKMGSLCEEALALAAKALANADGQTAAKIAPIDSEIDPVSYTHLDVYKRQSEINAKILGIGSSF